MAEWNLQGFRPINVAKDRDNRGREVDLTTEGAESLGTAPAAPRATPTERTAPDTATAPTAPSPTSSYNLEGFRPVESTSPYPGYRPVRNKRSYLTPIAAKREEEANTPTPLPERFEAGGLTKDKAMADPEVIESMRKGLDLRFGSRSAIAGVATGLTGGATGGFGSFASKTDEEIYETWQNWQRSFAGGQTVTTANEIAFAHNLKPEEKALLGEQYALFNKSPNIFSDDVSWSEMFDGLGDYVKAGVFDPTTVLSFGVGRALGAGGGKVAAMAVKESAAVAYKAALKKGATEAAARVIEKKAARNLFVKATVTNYAKYDAVDFVSNVATDIVQQNYLIDLGVQEEYSASQTGVAALSSIMLPAIMGSSQAFSAFSKSAKAPKGLKQAVDVAELFKDMKGDKLEDALKARVNIGSVESDIGLAAKNMQDNPDVYVKWSSAKEKAKSITKGLTELEDKELMFIRSFLFGDPDGKTKGFVQSMSDSGLVYVPRGTDDNITNFLGDAIGWIDPKSTVITDFVKTFQKAHGKTDAISKIKTPEHLMSFWKTRQSQVGSRLWDSKQSKFLLERNITESSTNSNLLNAVLREANPDEKSKREQGKYILSLYKSVLTSHPSTTVLNLKGWSVTQAANTAADMVQGALELMTAPIARVVGGEKLYQDMVQKGQASIFGSLRRGVNLLQPTDSIDKAAAYFELNPKILTELMSDMGGDSGATAGKETIKRFGLDPNAKINLKAESTRNFLQAVSGQKMQDELTKHLSFLSNLDLMIRREYGKSYNEFMSDPKLGFIEMNTPRYKKVVEANALDRTQREVFTKAWNTGSGRGMMKSSAQFMEKISSNEYLGYLIPFGKFFNNSMAFMGDYSGINAVRYLTPTLRGNTSSNAGEELSQLVAKGVVGFTAVSLLAPEQLEGLNEGIRWNQERNSDGSISDKTYDFPESMFRLVARLVAHQQKDGYVPKEIATEFVDTAVSQTFRQATDASETVYNLGTTLASGDMTEAQRVAMDVALGAGSRIVSGFTRPLDLPNTVVKFAQGDFQEPDRNISGDAFYEKTAFLKASRYTDEFFEFLGMGAEDVPRAASAVQPFGQVADGGKIIGFRGTAGNSVGEHALASVGRPSWKAFSWGNDPEFKNYMNRFVGPIFESLATQMMEKHDFDNLSLPKRQFLVDEVLAAARKQALESMSYASPEMELRDRLRKISGEKLKYAKDEMEISNPLDLLKEEGGLRSLDLFLSMAENYDELALGMK